MSLLFLVTLFIIAILAVVGGVTYFIDKDAERHDAGN
jgi:hypothetical protein